MFQSTEKRNMLINSWNITLSVSAFLETSKEKSISTQTNFTGYDISQLNPIYKSKHNIHFDSANDLWYDLCVLRSAEQFACNLLTEKFISCIISGATIDIVRWQMIWYLMIYVWMSASRVYVRNIFCHINCALWIYMI